jgi:HTH-type transcriptional regulator/antitoxin HigA
MNAPMLKESFTRFAELAAPYLNIRHETDYHKALSLVEALLEDVSDSPTDPLNAVIGLLTNSIQTYELKDARLAAFGNNISPELATLRVLMDQHGLGTADLPEIGSKSMVSRVLSGERDLSKKHIKALAQRFGVSPSLFLH